MDTPRDLNSRIKILELFVLHVLPANNEWDYAKSFVANSDILDDERRDAFLTTLNELHEVREQELAEAEAEQDLVGFAEETEDEDLQQNEGRIYMNENDDDQVIEDSSKHNYTPDRKHAHRRSSSEVDYGIDDDRLKARSPPPQSTATTKATSTVYSAPTSTRTISPAPSAPPPSSATASVKAVTPPVPTPQPTRKSSVVPARKGVNGPSRKTNSTNNNNRSQKESSHLAKLIRIISNITGAIASSLTTNPTQVFRTLMFVCALLAMLARRDVRERLRKIVGQGWLKVQQTAGMGMKVSYV